MSADWLLQELDRIYSADDMRKDGADSEVWSQIRLKLESEETTVHSMYEALTLYKALLLGDLTTYDTLLTLGGEVHRIQEVERERLTGSGCYLDNPRRVALITVMGKFFSQRAASTRAARQEYYLKILQGTEFKLLVNTDEEHVWGVGLSKTHADISKANKWLGMNLLGWALMKIRALFPE